MITLTFQGETWSDLIRQLQEAIPRFATIAKSEGEQIDHILPPSDTPRRKFKVLLSPYGDINPGDTGLMHDEKDDGYALIFDKQFSSAADPDTRSQQKRIVFFTKHQVEEIKS